MKKKISYLLGTTISLIASIFSSATASACGGDMGYIPPKSYKDTKVYTSENGKNSVVVNSKSSNKSSKYSKVLVDGMEVPVSSKGNASEKQRVLSAIKEIGCTLAKGNVNELTDPAKGEKIVKEALKKYGFKTDQKSMDALEAKYKDTVNPELLVMEAFKKCGGVQMQ